jgi:hypothetical protein
MTRAEKFWGYISFHAQGEGLYWSNNTPQALRLAERVSRETGFELLSEYEKENDCGHGNDHGNGEGAGIGSGEAKKNEPPDGGSFLEYVEATGESPFLTVELCPYVGPYPYPDADFDRVWRPAASICLMAADELLRRVFKSVPFQRP